MVHVVKETQVQEPTSLLDVIPNPSTSVVQLQIYVEQNVPVKDVLIMIQVAFLQCAFREEMVAFVFFFSFVHYL